MGVTCVEYNAAVIDDWDDRMIIGRRHAKSTWSVSREVSLPDEFSDGRIQEMHDDAYTERIIVPKGHLDSKLRK